VHDSLDNFRGGEAMTLATPTFSQIRWPGGCDPAEASAGHGDRHSFPGRWTGAVDLCEGTQRYLILQCDSPLAMRQALRLPTAPGTTRAPPTPLDEAQLSEDILLRLARRRSYQIDAWQIAR
jgi:hypothetical protein